MSKPSEVLGLDFSHVSMAFPNTMVPIISQVQLLQKLGWKLQITLPEQQKMQRLFINTNWAHFLSPDQYVWRNTPFSLNHIPVIAFNDNYSLRRLNELLVEKLMRSTNVSRAALSGFEWCLNELTDNVLNHADSAVGGVVQMTTLAKSQRINLCIADAGQGILKSLSHSFHAQDSDEKAILKAVQPGVTRDKTLGQGNGLTGSLGISLATHGSFRIISGSANVTWQDASDPQAIVFSPNQRYLGTCIDIQLNLEPKFEINRVLAEATHTQYAATYVDTIEMKYLATDGQTTRFSLAKESQNTGVGSRTAGAALRKQIVNIINAEPSAVLIIDWNDIEMISSSFADEFVGKLFLELGPTRFNMAVRQEGINPTVRGLIDRAILQRLKDAE